MQETKKQGFFTEDEVADIARECGIKPERDPYTKNALGRSIPLAWLTDVVNLAADRGFIRFKIPAYERGCAPSIVYLEPVGFVPMTDLPVTKLEPTGALGQFHRVAVEEPTMIDQMVEAAKIRITESIEASVQHHLAAIKEAFVEAHMHAIVRQALTSMCSYPGIHFLPVSRDVSWGELLTTRDIKASYTIDDEEIRNFIGYPPVKVTVADKELVDSISRDRIRSLADSLGLSVEDLMNDAFDSEYPPTFWQRVKRFWQCLFRW